MSALALAIACWVIGAWGAFLLRRRDRVGLLGAAAAVGGGAAAAFASVRALSVAVPAVWRTHWNVPAGALALRLDPLAAVFLLPIGVVGACGAVYGIAYLRRHAHGRPIGGSFAAYNVLLASMAVVVTADDLVLLLVAWELMTLSSWALVVSDHEDQTVRAAGVQYLIAGHLATAALILLVLFWSATSGGFAIAALTGHMAVPSGVLFVLALIGFGTKAGIVPMHVWLPDAHPAAPSHVSALMSAVMITMGFYGLARVIPLLGPPALWWGYLLMVLGAAGAVGGVVFAIAQRDVKRVLAYSTIENAGIVTLAIGVGLLGTALHRPVLAALAWTAALLHLWNHALAKTLLFLGFGAVAQGARSRSLDALGGLLRRWRLVGSALVIGAAAIVALPGLNVFTSEWLLLRALFDGGLELRGGAQLAMLAGIGVLVYAGGVAVVCFTRLVGIGLLGAPRTVGAAEATPPGWAMRVPLLMFAVACVGIALVPDRVAGTLAAAVLVVSPAADVGVARSALEPVAMVLPLVAGVIAVVLALRGAVGRLAPRAHGDTWRCGYTAPNAAMQYTSTSYSEPLTSLLQPLLRTRVQQERPAVALATGARPRTARWASLTADPALTNVYQPLFSVIDRVTRWLRRLHTARVTASLVYIVVTMLVVLALLVVPGRTP